MFQEFMNFIEKDMAPSNRLNKGAKEKLKSRITDWAFAQAELVGRIKELEKENKRLRETTAQAPTVSYAQMTSQRLTAQTKIAKLVTNTQKPATLFVSGKNAETAKQV